jgi:excisionase family DNA binding protein
MPAPVLGRTLRPRTLRRRECAELYGVSVWLIDKLIADGELRATRAGRAVLIDAASADARFGVAHPEGAA